MRSFGQWLRHHRRQASDPLRGGLLTQARLGELIGDALGDAGYSGAAVSDWERDKSKISEDDRLVLVALLEVLHQCQGLDSMEAADRLLRAGNYRALDESERVRLFSRAAGPGPTGRWAPRPARDRRWRSRRSQWSV